MMDTIVQGDCLEVMPTLQDKSVDMILCDLPYGKTAAAWDTIIPIDALWQQYKRLIKPRGAIVLTAVQPFTSLLVTSNLKWYRHNWVWDKGMGIGITAKTGPISSHEDILIFGSTIRYFPQMTPMVKSITIDRGVNTSVLFGGLPAYSRTFNERYPKSVIRIPRIGVMHPERIHPTQKPVALFDYLIRTYTQPGQVVLDNCSGSGTTAIAAYLSDRHFICIEKDATYWQKSNERLERERRKIRAWAIPGFAEVAE